MVDELQLQYKWKEGARLSVFDIVKSRFGPLMFYSVRLSLFTIIYSIRDYYLWHYLHEGRPVRHRLKSTVGGLLEIVYSVKTKSIQYHLQLEINLFGIVYTVRVTYSTLSTEPEFLNF